MESSWAALVKERLRAAASKPWIRSRGGRRKRRCCITPAHVKGEKSSFAGGGSHLYFSNVTSGFLTGGFQHTLVFSSMRIAHATTGSHSMLQQGAPSRLGAHSVHPIEDGAGHNLKCLAG